MDAGHVTREINIRLPESGVGEGFVDLPFRRPHFALGYVFRAAGPDVTPPFEALEFPLVRRKLDDGEGVVADIFEVKDMVQLAILEAGGEHLGLDGIYCCEGAVLLEIEKGIGAAQGIETLHRARGIEEGHHLRSADLVVEEGILLDGDKGFGHQRGAVHPVIADQRRYAVGRELAVRLVPDKRPLIEPGQRIKIGIGKRIADNLEVLAENLDITPAGEEADAGRVHRSRRRGGRFHGRAVE